LSQILAKSYAKLLIINGLFGFYFSVSLVDLWHTAAGLLPTRRFHPAVAPAAAGTIAKGIPRQPMREGVTMGSLEYWQICEQRMRELAQGSGVTARVSATTALPVAGRRRDGR
jgi:hypothetical protein